jgi:hypothetical protein
MQYRKIWRIWPIVVGVRADVDRGLRARMGTGLCKTFHPAAAGENGVQCSAGFGPGWHPLLRRWTPQSRSLPAWQFADLSLEQKCSHENNSPLVLSTVRKATVPSKHILSAS